MRGQDARAARCGIPDRTERPWPLRRGGSWPHTGVQQQTQTPPPWPPLEKHSAQVLTPAERAFQERQAAMSGERRRASGVSCHRARYSRSGDVRIDRDDGQTCDLRLAAVSGKDRSAWSSHKRATRRSCSLISMAHPCVALGQGMGGIVRAGETAPLRGWVLAPTLRLCHSDAATVRLNPREASVRGGSATWTGWWSMWFERVRPPVQMLLGGSTPWLRLAAQSP